MALLMTTSPFSVHKKHDFYREGTLAVTSKNLLKIYSCIFWCAQLEKHFGNPRDIEFAVGKDGTIYLLQVTLFFDLHWFLNCCLVM